MGVDGFRVDTVKHISRLTWNNDLLPQLTKLVEMILQCLEKYVQEIRSVWNRNIPALSAPFLYMERN